jgi:transglutaminase-like putative cysteine protease
MLYFRETLYTTVTPAIREFAARFESALGEDRIKALHEVMLGIADRVEYSPGDTHVHTTGAEALEQGTGVCQDHAHVFCAICRALGVPSRYVSGYLTHGLGHEAHAASHAWAEAFVDSLGWVGFDPTNRACPDESYIRIAVGLDYAEAGPVRGVRAGGGVETMTVKVSFPSQQQAQ